MNQKVSCIHQQERCSEDDLKGMMLLPIIQKAKQKTNPAKRRCSLLIQVSLSQSAQKWTPIRNPEAVSVLFCRGSTVF